MTKFTDQQTLLTYRDGQSETMAYHKCKLLVVEGRDCGSEYVMESDVIRVGTAPENDVCLTESTVSRQHFEIRITRFGYLIRDLGSTNGTEVAGFRIVEAYLQPTARIRAGDAVLVFEPLHEVVKVPLSSKYSFGRMLGRSLKMRALFHLAQRIVSKDVTVLITGPTGTGKGLLAEEIHRYSHRAHKPMVVVDCSAIPAHLMESELFGHVKGAFTGAVSSTIGLFEQAHGSTLLLDEIGELPPMLQPKLLRVLESREVKKIGDTKTTRVDVRILACTNQDLKAKVGSGEFRQDLFFRLGGIEIKLPPLKERKEDIPMLAQACLDVLCPQSDRKFDEAAIQILLGYEWPGNVRELRNLVERVAHLVDEQIIDPSSLLGSHCQVTRSNMIQTGQVSRGRQSFHHARQVAERGYLIDLLRDHDNNVSRAARTAGIQRQSLHRLLKKHAIGSPQEE